MSTRRTKLRRAFSTNTAGGAFSAKAGTLTQPAHDPTAGVFHLDKLAHHVDSLLLVIPFGTDTNNDQFEFQIWGWMPTDDNPALWVPHRIIEFTATLSGSVATNSGVATEYFADTLAENDGDTDTVRTVSYADDTSAAYALVDIVGVQIIEFEFNPVGAGPAVACNCFWSTMS